MISRVCPKCMDAVSDLKYLKGDPFDSYDSCMFAVALLGCCYPVAAGNPGEVLQ